MKIAYSIFFIFPYEVVYFISVQGNFQALLATTISKLKIELKEKAFKQFYQMLAVKS